jgi:hypothetical protein
MTDRPHEQPSEETELVELIRSIDVPAPAYLHERVQAMVDERSRRRGWGAAALPLRAAAATAIGAVAIAVVLVLALTGSGGGHPLSLQRAAALTLRPATQPAPSESTLQRGQLTASVDGIAFPYWHERFGWRSTGSRRDVVGGRPVTTVFYADSAGHRVGYAIVSGTPAPPVSGGVVRWHGGHPYRLSLIAGSRVVTWHRAGHLCVISGRGIDGAKLLRMAGWEDHARAA